MIWIQNVWHSDGFSENVDFKKKQQKKKHEKLASSQRDIVGPAWPQGYKTISMLNSAGHQIYPAHKC